MRSKTILGAAAGVAMALAAGSALAAETATATLHDLEMNEVGTVDLKETPNGVLMTVELDGLPEGTHAFHIHETGKCEPPFKSAGGHFNPTGAHHGILSAKGKHAGDLPNIHVTGGSLTLEVLAAEVTLAEGKDNSLFDDDGSAIVIHEGADDYISNPAGDAGSRIACGVIE
jgi:Cu-Zn family superoxide dismutase